MSAAIGIFSLAGLMAVGLPLAFAMTLLGFLGFMALTGLDPAIFMLGQIVHSTATNYSFSALPMFILMGNFIAQSRLADELFAAADAFIGHKPGGLAQATILASGGLACVSGSSSATAATMVKVALPAMRRKNYDDRLAFGAIAVGGTLGVLIPPSAILLLYGLMTETNVAKLFAAGILPGVVAIILHMSAIYLLGRWKPEYGPRGERASWSQRGRLALQVWGILVLFGLVMGGILGGIFTPTEGAAIGAFGAMLFAAFRGTLNMSVLSKVLVETGVTSVILFAIAFGAFAISNFLDISGFPNWIGSTLKASGISPWGVMLSILVIYIILGMFMETISMLFLTVPLFFPIIVSLGFDPIWFGVVVVIVIELGLITPPIGLNLFVLKAMEPEVTWTTLVRGALPFIVTTLILLLLVCLFPWLSLYLPSNL